MAIRAERKLGRVCSDEQYDTIFDRLYVLPPGTEHLIVQLGNASPSVTVAPSETERLNRDSDRVSPNGVFGERVIIEIQPSCYAGAVGIFRYIERVCEQV